MIKIRLARYGNTNRPYFRVIAIDEQKKTTGEALEILGTWNPQKGEIEIDKKKVDMWINKGAQLSSAVSHLLEGKPKPKHLKKKDDEVAEATDIEPAKEVNSTVDETNAAEPALEDKTEVAAQ